MTLAIRAFNGAVSPVAELGPDAMFVDAQLQPHVLFTMGSLVLDVDAEHIQSADSTPIGSRFRVL